MNLAYKKILGKFTKVLGFGKTPPPCWEKFPNDIVFFLRAYLIQSAFYWLTRCKLRGGPANKWLSVVSIKGRGGYSIWKLSRVTLSSKCYSPWGHWLPVIMPVVTRPSTLVTTCRQNWAKQNEQHFDWSCASVLYMMITPITMIMRRKRQVERNSDRTKLSWSRRLQFLQQIGAFCHVVTSL